MLAVWAKERGGENSCGEHLITLADGAALSQMGSPQPDKF